MIGTAITMTTGNITGNLTVGGVLTYEDVTNVDSIGIVTARSGVKVVGGGKYCHWCIYVSLTKLELD